MKTIVLCGSMKFKDKIIDIQKELETMGFDVLIPEECIQGLPKEVASRAHFDRICDSKTDAILVVNENKGDIINYIGPNSFAEIAFAFYYKKDIYLLNDIYDSYKDELLGWKVNSLKGNLNLLETK